MTTTHDMVNALIYIKRQQGLLQALEMTWQFVREPFYEHHNGYVLRKSLDEPIIIPQADVDLELRQLSLNDLDVLKTIMPALRVKRIAKKIEAGEICNTAIKNGEVIGFVLAAFEGTPSTRQVHLTLAPDEAYLWSGYALPQFRRQKVVKVVNLSLCKILQERGCKRVVLLVEKTNIASLGHCFKMNYHITDQISYLRVLNQVRCSIMPAQMDERLFLTEHAQKEIADERKS